MSIADTAAVTLLAAGVFGFLFTALGLAVMRQAFDRLHYLAPASLIGAVAVPLAVLVREGPSQLGVKALLIAIILFWSNPVLSHAIARAARIRRHGRWQPGQDENVRTAEDRPA